MSRSPAPREVPAEALAVVPARRLPATSPATAEKALRILEQGTAENTRRAYRGDLAYFWAWAAADLALEERYPAPPAAVLKFAVDHLEGLEPGTDDALLARRLKARPGPHSVATVERRLAALSKAHQLQGVANPCAAPEIRELLSKARRRASQEGQTPRRKRAATLDVLEALLATCGEDLAGKRDRALLLFAFSSGGRRRSEVAAAAVEDLTAVEGGFLFRLRRSKTDQEGEGVELPVLGRAAEALRDWLAAAALAEGAIFRQLGRHARVGAGLSAKSVALIVKRRARAAGFDPEVFAGHSLRSGFVTEGGRRGEALGNLLALSRHRSLAVALTYYQAGAVLQNPAARLAG